MTPYICPLCQNNYGRWEQIREFREVITFVEEKQRNFTTSINRCVNCGFMATIYKEEGNEDERAESKQQDTGDGTG